MSKIVRKKKSLKKYKEMEQIFDSISRIKLKEDIDFPFEALKDLYLSVLRSDKKEIIKEYSAFLTPDHYNTIREQIRNTPKEFIFRPEGLLGKGLPFMDLWNSKCPNCGVKVRVQSNPKSCQICGIEFNKGKTEISYIETETEKTRSRHIPERVRHEVWKRDMGRCVECGSQERLEYDHIIPFSKGGSNTARNIQLLCEKCNRSKYNKI